MRNEPTFYQGMDWYGLVELGPAAREILNLMLPACRPGRNGHIEHSVHVMATWFTEATQHWETPVTPSKARRGLNELAEKGIISRHNGPQDGAGFVITFNMNPPVGSTVPVSGFRHAEEVSERCGVRAIFRRIGDETPRQVRAERSAQPKVEGQEDPFSDQIPEVYANGDPDPEFDLSGLEENAPGPVGSEAEFAAELEEVTGRNAEPRLRLLKGQCERIAEAARPALELGWEPRALALRMASELNPKIHSPQQLLVKKLGEVGTPPQKRRVTTLEPSPDRAGRSDADRTEEDSARLEAAKARYQENLRMRQMAGSRKRT